MTASWGVNSYSKSPKATQHAVGGVGSWEPSLQSEVFRPLDHAAGSLDLCRTNVASFSLLDSHFPVKISGFPLTLFSLPVFTYDRYSNLLLSFGFAGLNGKVVMIYAYTGLIASLSKFAGHRYSSSLINRHLESESQYVIIITSKCYYYGLILTPKNEKR